MNKVFVTSDTHFLHKNMLKINPETRPWGSVEEMTEQLIERWNAVVGRTDTVYHLGDIAMGSKKKIPDILSRLNGRVHLILGNHDKMFAGFDQKGIMFLKPFGQEIITNGSLVSIQPYMEISHKGKFVVMSHYAMEVWNKKHYGSYMLFGHSHGSLWGRGRKMDVGIDACEMPSNGAPFLLDDVLRYLDTKEVDEGVDHYEECRGE